MLTYAVLPDLTEYIVTDPKLRQVLYQSGVSEVDYIRIALNACILYQGGSFDLAQICVEELDNILDLSFYDGDDLVDVTLERCILDASRIIFQRLVAIIHTRAILTYPKVKCVVDVTYLGAGTYRATIEV